MNRIGLLQQQLHADGLDAILIGSSVNRRYMSGFTGSAGMALITLSEAIFFTDFRYTQQATTECNGWRVVQTKDEALEAIGQVLAEGKVGNLAYEKAHVTVAEYESYQPLEQRVSGLRLQGTQGLVERLRRKKALAEVDKIQHAAQIADQTFVHMLDVLRPGMTEQAACLELEHTMRTLGASGAAFATIIASGWRSALPHGVASEKVLARGDFVTMDFGAVYDGYVSDLTRTVCLGPASDEQRKVYEVVLEAQSRGLEAARPGLIGRELDAVARDYIALQGYGEAFGHSLGHGIGLEIHEEPRISVKSDVVLESGMVITIEPGIYLPEFGGVRIEDDVLLTDGGSVVLTHATKELICL